MVHDKILCGRIGRLQQCVDGLNTVSGRHQAYVVPLTEVRHQRIHRNQCLAVQSYLDLVDQQQAPAGRNRRSRD